jgi:hypothetical protein
VTPPAGNWGKQLDWFDPESCGEPLDGLQGQVPLAAFDGTHVGPVDAQKIGKCLLAQTALSAVRPQISAQGPLEIAFPHQGGTLPAVLLFRLHTYK